ncbi:MAG: hypothetical protein ACLTFB_00985 [Candidatus Phytoplasma pyri]
MFNKSRFGYYLLIITTQCFILNNLFSLFFDLMLGIKINILICLFYDLGFLIHLITNDHKAKLNHED